MTNPTKTIATSESLTIIEPNRSWLRIPWREIWEYRDLLRVLVRRNFVAAYKQTVLGPVWFFVNPIFNTLVATIIFGKLARLPTDNLPKPLFYMCSGLGWSYFAGCWNASASVFLANKDLFAKVYFPRLIIPFANSINNLFGIAIQFLTFCCLWAYFKFFTTAGATFGVSSALVLIPFCLVQSALLGIGVGLWFSSLSAKYRDVARLGSMLSSVWRYATPVVWPLSLYMEKIPSKWHWVPGINPMTWIVECFRVAFLGQGTLEARHVLVSIGVTAVIFVSGIMIFNRTERTFIDTA